MGGDVATAWRELWEELYHQGDVGEASYAALPELVRVYAVRSVPDWNIYAYAASLEEARRNARNPAVPEWLRPEYEAALIELQALALREFSAAQEAELVRSIIAVLAFSKGCVTLGRIALWTEDERQEALGEL